MQPNPTTDPAPRPAEFDARVMAYYGVLQALAYKLSNTLDERDELVQDTLIYVFGAWRNFRMDPSAPYKGLYTWLTLCMRSVAQAKRRRVKRKLVPLSACDKSTAPQQEDIVYANEVVRRLSYTREGRILVRIGGGEKLKDIGARRGVSPERVRQLAEKARERLVRAGVAA